MIIGGCSQERQNVLDKDVIKVGMELKYPPFETKDAEGNPAGVSVDLARALGDYLGKEIEIVETSYPSLIPSLVSEEIDLIISSMTITEERANKVDFSIPYTTSQLMMLVHKDSDVHSYKDLNNEDVTIVNKAGTIAAIWASNNAPEANIKDVGEESTAVLEVAQGKGDVFIYDPLSIIRHHQNYPDSTRTILEPLPNTKGWGIAMPENQDALKEKINEFIKKAKTDGTFDTIRNRHLQDKIEVFEKHNLDFFF